MNTQVLLRLAMLLGWSHLGFSAEVVVTFGSQVNPQHIAITAGDTVTWHYASDTSGTNFLMSFGDEWQTGTVRPGESVSRVFTNAAFYAYHTADYPRALDRSLTVGTITVYPSDTARDAVWLAAPIEGPVYGGRFLRFAAGVNSPEAEIEKVEFYSGSRLLGTAPARPYQIDVVDLAPILTEHVIYARAIDKNGLAYSSRPVRLSLGFSTSSFLKVLPRGEVLVHVAAPILRGQIDFTDDLVNWRTLTTIFGEGIILDESATNAIRRFYTWRLQNPP